MGRGGSVFSARMRRARPLRQRAAACRHPQENYAGPDRHAHPERNLRAAGTASQLLETAGLAGGGQSGLGAGRCGGLPGDSLHGGTAKRRPGHARSPGGCGACRPSRATCAADHHAGPANGFSAHSNRFTGNTDAAAQPHGSAAEAAAIPAAPAEPARAQAQSEPAAFAPPASAAPMEPASRPAAPARRSSPAPAKALAPETADTPPAANYNALPPVGTVPGYYINVGLFAEEANARKAQARLLNEGLPAFRQEIRTGKKRRLRVRVGPYGDRADADAAAATIRSMTLEAVVIRLGT